MATVLIVEDDPQVMKFLCNLIKSLEGGHDIKAARTSTDGVALLEKGGIDLIILDLQLAEATSGRRFLVHLYHLFERGLCGNIPVFIVSGIDRRDLEGLTKAYSFVRAAFSKPFDMDDLAEAIQEALM
jgi:CheY-like chemotaxis protein